jgi:hypothetical protein
MRWRVTALLFIILAAGVAVGTLILSPEDQRPGAVSHARPSEHFSTLPPQSELPSASQCATRVRSNPIPENKGVNATFNRATGHSVGELFPASDDPRANREISSRIDGQFTGSTAEILRWAACKWGIDEDIVAAQAAVESWWRQTTLGDFDTDPAACPPGHGLGVDAVGGKCPQSYGILQNRYPYERATWPGIGASTAMNADTAYGIWRACFEGFELWLNQVEHTGEYAAGDLWGCIGRWYAGRWHTVPAETYITKVRDYMARRVWQDASFQEP